VADRILQRPFFVFVGLGSGFSQKEDNKITSFAETFIDWRGETFGGTGRFYLSLKDILGFNEKITSNIPNGSVIVLSLPESLNITSLNIEPADARIIDNTVMLLVNSSDAYDDLKVSFEARFPPSVTVTKDVQPSIASVEGVVSITIEVRNLGNVPVTNVEVNDEDALNVYSSTLTVISGSPKASWGLLSGNESKVMTYSVKLGANGKYTLKPAEVSYNDQYGHYTRQSETTVITSEFNVAVYLQRLFITPLTIDTVNLSPSLQQLLKFNPFLTALIFMIVLPPVVELVRRAIQRHKPNESKPPKEEVV